MSGFTDVIKSVAQMLATALGGPLAGMAATFLAGKLGLPESSIEAVSNAVAGMSGADLVRMKEIEADFQKHMADNGIALDLAQIGTNTEEAKSADRFVAGWRPFIGWVCGAGMAYAAIILPVMEFVS